MEDVIGTVMNKGCPDIAAGGGDMFERLPVDRKGMVPIILASVDIRVCGGIDDQFRLQAADKRDHGTFVRDIEIMSATDSARELLPEVMPEHAKGPENEDGHLFNGLHHHSFSL
jgi:hypothetical protein